MNIATKDFRPRRCGESAIKPNRFGDVMMENLDPVRLARAVAGAAVLVGVVASIASCSGNGANAPSTTQSPTTTTTTTMQSPTPGAPPPAPTEKSINPTAGNLFTPTVHAPPAPTAIPGNRENTG
jgi:hypothetical protein